MDERLAVMPPDELSSWPETIEQLFAALDIAPSTMPRPTTADASPRSGNAVGMEQSIPAMRLAGHAIYRVVRDIAFVRGEFRGLRARFAVRRLPIERIKESRQSRAFGI